MKIVSYLKNSKATYGIVRDGRVTDLGSRLHYADINAFIAGGQAALDGASRAEPSAADEPY